MLSATVIDVAHLKSILKHIQTTAIMSVEVFTMTVGAGRKEDGDDRVQQSS